MSMRLHLVSPRTTVLPDGRAYDRDMILGDCQLAADESLSTPSGSIQLTRRQGKILRSLIATQGVAVPTDALLDSAWNCGAGSSQGLAKAIFQLRRALEHSQRVRIESVYGFGYRLRLLDADDSRGHRAQRAAILCNEAALRVYERRETSLMRALGLYETAVELDPSNAEALTGYATAALHLVSIGWRATELFWPSAREAIEQALLIEPLNATALALRGLSHCFHGWNHDAARKDILHAREFADASPTVHELAARIWLFHGKASLAIAHSRRILEINPAYMSAYATLSVAHGLAGDGEAALETLESAHRVEPGCNMLAANRSWAHANYGDPETALAIASAFEHEELSAASVPAAVRANALANAGQHATARAELERLQRLFDEDGRYCALNAFTWTTLGDHDQALDALDRAARAHDYWLGLALNDPLNAALHALPRFQEIRRRIFGPKARARGIHEAL